MSIFIMRVWYELFKVKSFVEMVLINILDLWVWYDIKMKII